jgi:hypothetical protein
MLAKCCCFSWCLGKLNIIPQILTEGYDRLLVCNYRICQGLNSRNWLLVNSSRIHLDDVIRWGVRIKVRFRHHMILIIYHFNGFVLSYSLRERSIFQIWEVCLLSWGSEREICRLYFLNRLLIVLLVYQFFIHWFELLIPFLTGLIGLTLHLCLRWNAALFRVLSRQRYFHLLISWIRHDLLIKVLM